MLLLFDKSSQLHFPHPHLPMQVMKLSGDGNDKPLIVLGEAFVPGSDENHFCKPTDVAVDPVSGNIYVSDGYCNRRILKFSPNGKYLKQWGAGETTHKMDTHTHTPGGQNLSG